ncbi:Ger(x)C family spore germination protein [Vallitalea guaymasensis]|uniref:Ger(x)C family spore germination protein n=1 Tax=Vallitalea guaymasensis TaxID=1185412 RepID=UPI000DE2D452|nr:Ger(x)C family spore germination protein [Vallitalea guaymasensis]
MKGIKYSILIIIIIANSILCTSCWNYREINDLSVIFGLGIDKKDGLYEFTGKILLTANEENEGNNLSQTFISSQGLTIFDAIRNLVLKDGKRVYFGHLAFIIISEDIAKENINEVLDLFMRDDETREDMWMFVAPEPYSSKEILEIGLDHQELATYVNDTMINMKHVGKSYPIRLYEFINISNSKGKNGVVPLIFIKKTLLGESAYIIGNAVFNGNQMVGKINGDECKTLCVILNEQKGGILPVTYNDEAETTTVSLEIGKTKTKLNPVFTDDNITIKISTQTTAVIAEIMNNNVNVLDKEGKDKLIEAAENMIENNIKDLVKKAQAELNSDIFGFGQLIKKDNPSLWKQIEDDWSNIFQDIDIEVNSVVEISGSALYEKIIK